MSERLNKWLGKGPENRNSLSPEALARIIRDRQLDIFDFGVVGSNVEVPIKQDSKTIKLPTLLRYSPRVIQHMQTFRGILSSPEEFEIETNALNPYDRNLNADIVYSKEGPNHVYYFTDQIIKPFSKAWESGIQEGTGATEIIVSVMQENRKRNGVWIVSYDFYDLTADETTGRKFPGGNLHPEQEMLLQFWYSAKRLDLNYFLKNFPSAQIVKDHLTKVDEKKTTDFRYFNFHYDSLSHADKEEKMPYIEDLAVRYSSFLRKKGILISQLSRLEQ